MAFHSSDLHVDVCVVFMSVLLYVVFKFTPILKCCKCYFQATSSPLASLTNRPMDSRNV